MSSKDDLINEFAQAEERHKEAPKKPELSSEKPAAAEHTHISSGHHKKKRKKLSKTMRNLLGDKTLGKMLNVFLLCLIVNGIEYFFLINTLHIPTRGAIGKILGAIIIIGYMYTARLKPHNVGLAPNHRAILSAIRNALFFCVALVPAYLIELIQLKLSGHEVVFTVFAYTAIHSDVGTVYWAANVLLLIVINLLSAVMLEVLFRGILMKMGKGKFGFTQTTIIVSIFYSLWYLIIPLSKVLGGIGNVLPLCIFYLVFEFFMSVKWCLCTRATGSIWLALFDHFFFTTAVGLLHIVDITAGVENSIDSSKYFRYIAIQVVSFAICWAYYKHKMHRKERLLQEVGVRSIYSFDSLADKSEEDVSRQAERIKTTEGEIDAEYLRHLEKLNEDNNN